MRLPVLLQIRIASLKGRIESVEMIEWSQVPGLSGRDMPQHGKKKKKIEAATGQHGYPRSYQEGRNTAHFLSFSYFFTHRAQW